MLTRFNFENHPGYEKLKEAFRLSNKDFLSSIELAPEEDVYFSSRYEKKMAHLIKRQKRPYWKYVNTVGKRIAVIAIAFMMLFGLSMSIKAIREPVIGFIENVFEKFSELFVDKSEIKNAPDKIEEVYTLTDLPEGFVENEQILTDSFVETHWSNGSTSIVLRQSVIISNLTIDIEDSDSIAFVQNNMEIHFLSKNNTTYATWQNNRYIFEIICRNEIPVATMKEIIKSIKIKE